MDIMQKNLEKMKRILEHEQEVEDMNKRVNVISGELTDLDAEKNRLIMTSKLRPLKEKEIAEKQRELEEIKRVIALKEADLTRDKKELKDNMKASLQAEMDLYVYQEDIDKMRQAVEEKKASILKEADDLTPIIEGYEAQKEKLQKEKERFEKIKTQIEQKITNGETVPDSHLSNAVSNIYFYQSRIDEFDRKIQSITEEIETKIEDIHNEKAELSKYKVLEDHVEEYSELENLFVRLDNNFDVAKEVEALEKDSEPEVDPIPEETSGVFGEPVLSQEESSEPVANPEPAEEPISEEDWPEYDFSSAEEMPEEVGLSSEEIAEIFGETQSSSNQLAEKLDELQTRVGNMSKEDFKKFLEGLSQEVIEKFGHTADLTEEEINLMLEKITEIEVEKISQNLFGRDTGEPEGNPYDVLLGQHSNNTQNTGEDKSLTAPPETRMEKFVGFVGGIVGHIPGAKWVAKKAKALWKKFVGLFKTEPEEEEIWDASYDEAFEDGVLVGDEEQNRTEQASVQAEMAKKVREIVEENESRKENHMAPLAYEYKGVEIENTGSLKAIIEYLEGKEIKGKGRLIIPKAGDYKMRLKPDGSLEEDKNQPIDRSWNGSLRNEEAARKIEGPMEGEKDFAQAGEEAKMNIKVDPSWKGER